MLEEITMLENFTKPIITTLSLMKTSFSFPDSLDFIVVYSLNQLTAYSNEHEITMKILQIKEKYLHINSACNTLYQSIFYVDVHVHYIFL